MILVVWSQDKLGHLKVNGTLIVFRLPVSLTIRAETEDKGEKLNKKLE